MAVKTRNQISPVKRVTRANVKQGLVTESLPEMTSSSSKKTKKVKFLDPGKEQEANKNTSLVSDEGIDMSFSPSPGLQLPQAISRPQHKLQQCWTMWYSPKNQKTNWCENQHQVCSMATVEDFWRTYNQVKLASKLQAGSTYAVFKKGVNPDWEDKANAQGGRWMLYFDRRERQGQLDSRWMEALLMTLGDHLGQAVSGVQVCIRKKLDRIEIWLGSSKMRSVAEVGRTLKQQLGFAAVKMEFSIHLEEKEGLKVQNLTLV